MAVIIGTDEKIKNTRRSGECHSEAAGYGLLYRYRMMLAVEHCKATHEAFHTAASTERVQSPEGAAGDHLSPPWYAHRWTVYRRRSRNRGTYGCPI